jgi:phosphatidylglycerol---prolipoprotein diacylglyceryl transferase
MNELYHSERTFRNHSPNIEGIRLNERNLSCASHEFGVGVLPMLQYISNCGAAFMPTLYTTIGPFTLQSFTLFLMLSVLISTGINLAPAGENRGKWADVYLAALIGGVIVARSGHILLNWEYFTYNTSEIWRLNSGGLDWHGAVIGGLIGLHLVARWHRINPAALLDSLALGLPLIALSAWWGCLAANCGYGAEVDTLANYPSLMVSESPDVYGLPAPRYNTQLFGLMLSLLLLGFALLLHWRGWLVYRQFSVVLALMSLGLFVMGFWRGDYAIIIAGLRADQWLDAGLLLLGMAQLARARHAV